MATVRLTVAQALVRFLANQYSERDGVQRRLVPGCFGIFGHGNVAGVAQALLQAEATGSAELPYHLARNEQAMVHASVAFAKTLNRLQTMACTASIGPGSTNMLTGAALATANRIPVLLLPSDIFATRVASPVIRARTIDEFRDALKQAKAARRTIAVHIETDPLAPVPSSDSWWDVPVSEVAELDSTRQARTTYEAHKANQRSFLTPLSSPRKEHQ
jgi:TPP-dependent trihydroxycyclohexane-1,2-dione (THcHDO) dehydratase